MLEPVRHMEIMRKILSLQISRTAMRRRTRMASLSGFHPHRIHDSHAQAACRNGKLHLVMLLSLLI